MAGNWHNERGAELRTHWKANPDSVLGLYRHLMALDVLSELPPGLTLDTMIDAIVSKEAEQRSFDKPNP